LSGGERLFEQQRRDSDGAVSPPSKNWIPVFTRR